MTKWTREDQKLLDELIERKTQFRKQREAAVEEIVKRFYYPDISPNVIVEGICCYAEDLIKLLGNNDESGDNNSNEWIEWKGGECPLPYGTMVRVRLRNGLQYEGAALISTGMHHGNWYVGFYNDPRPTRADIVAYQLMK